MKTIHASSAILLLLLFFPVTVYCQIKGEVSNSKGLNTASFETKEGKVNVYFPDLQGGDVISGTVLAEPAGSNQRQKNKNSNVISGYVVEVENDNNEQDKTLIKDKIFKWAIPPVVTEGLRLVLTDPKGMVIGTADIPVMKDVPYMAVPKLVTKDNFAIPEYIQAGSPASIPGIFDGDFSSTSLNIGGNDVNILAESPRGIFFETPQEISGPTTIQLKEGDVDIPGQTTAFGLFLTADRLTLQRGDRTTVHVKVEGLEGLNREIPVDITNLTENTVTLAGGNQQTVTIRPGAVNADGIYAMDIPVTAIGSGGFSVSVNVKPPEPVVINRIHPLQETGSPEPNFVWSVLNAPPECTYTVKIWDIRAYTNEADRQSFIISPGMTEGIQPVVSQSGLPETSFVLSEMDDFRLEPDRLYAWQVQAETGTQSIAVSPVWDFSVNASAKENYIHIKDGQFASKYYPSGWEHVRNGQYASKIYNPATHRHLTYREYNTKIYSTADYRHITGNKDKTKIYPANLRHITSGANETQLYDPGAYQPHRTTGSMASLLIPTGHNHLNNEADRTKVYPSSDRHLTTGDNNTKVVPADHVHLTREGFNSKIYPRSARHIDWGTTNVTKIIPQGMTHIDSGEDLSKLHPATDRHLKGGNDNTKLVPGGSEHVSGGNDQSKIYPSGNQHIRTGTNASGVFNPGTQKHRNSGDDLTKIIPRDYNHISSGPVQSKYGPSGANHIREGGNATKLNTREGQNIEPGEAQNPPGTAEEAPRPGASNPPGKEAVKPDKEAERPSQQPGEPGEPQEPKELDEW